VTSPAFASPDGPPAHILVAEDHDDSRDALRALLEACGYAVRVATNGREAVDEALAATPDLILMDLMMPEMDGLSATRALRNHAGFPAVPILAITAMEGARPAALEAGCNDHIPKPIQVRALLEKIRDWISVHRTSASN
jgi:two-component system, sensor histidine kinase and response regulator